MQFLCSFKCCKESSNSRSRRKHFNQRWKVTSVPAFIGTLKSNCSKTFPTDYQKGSRSKSRSLSTYGDCCTTTTNIIGEILVKTWC